MKPGEWKDREKRLSGSDIAYLMTNNDWRPLYRQKVHGEKMPFYATEDAAAFGHDIEPVMARYVSRKTGDHIILNSDQVTFVHDDPRFCATPDGWVYGKNDDIFSSEPAGIFECKTTTNGDEWGASMTSIIAPKAYWQTVYYCWLWKVRKAHIGALVCGVQRHYTIYPAEPEFERVIETANAFWSMLQSGKEPPAPPEKRRKVPPDVNPEKLIEAAEKYELAKINADEAEAAKKAAREIIIHEMGGYEIYDGPKWKIQNIIIEKKPVVDWEAVINGIVPVLTEDQQRALEDLIRKSEATPPGFRKLTVTRKK